MWSVHQWQAKPTIWWTLFVPSVPTRDPARWPNEMGTTRTLKLGLSKAEITIANWGFIRGSSSWSFLVPKHTRGAWAGVGVFVTTWHVCVEYQESLPSPLCRAVMQRHNSVNLHIYSLSLKRFSSYGSSQVTNWNWVKQGSYSATAS